MLELSVRDGDGAPVIHHLSTARIRIGRGADNEIVLHDAAISRLHVELRTDGGDWYAIDQGSHNGTRLCGRPLRVPRMIRPGDELQVGRFVLTLLPVAIVPAGADGSTATGSPSNGRETSDGSHRTVLVGRSDAMTRVRQLVQRVAPLDAAVLVTGETGTGKELVARLLHLASPRAAGPFVVVNCPSQPPSLADAELFGVERGVATGVEPRVGRLELADGGTLFLDEVGDLDESVQPKLLRFLQDGSLDRVGSRRAGASDVRVVAATNRDLERAVRDGAFRRDLYHRLAGVVIPLPSLRERLDDVPELVDHFLERLGPGGPSMSLETLRVLQRHDYPGNVRQLEHVVRLARALATGPEIRPEDLPDQLRLASGVGEEEAESPGSTARALHARIVEEGASFWEVIKEPFMRRELAREVVEAFLGLARADAGGTYRAMARRLGIDAEYRQLINFINYHRLGRRSSPDADDRAASR